MDEIRLFDTLSNENKVLAEFGFEPAFSPDGHLIVYSTPQGCEANEESSLWVVSIHGLLNNKFLDAADEPSW